MSKTIGRDRTTIQRIVKVNHAGETGAIKIYAAQIAIARRLFPHVVPELEKMRLDEVNHCGLFRDAMPARGARPCRVMSLWSLGGYVLGASTALMGERMVWICTEAVESTVHHHLLDQLAFLQFRDPELHRLIGSIQEEELDHLRTAQQRQKPGGVLHSTGVLVIGALTSTMIWLSTWGDTSRMKQELAGAARKS
ncbi:demethoxyubiquinone hydroxylase family protein [Mesorhizobium sp. ASY16-5R]|uniref:demethoxyubiquinone hydroxylase family protein n=1 Tax=Mesorhizobium sp. ASY16-5R TaxID=3445772 RepID=UPI003F9F9A30